MCIYFTEVDIGHLAVGILLHTNLSDSKYVIHIPKVSTGIKMTWVIMAYMLPLKMHTCGRKHRKHFLAAYNQILYKYTYQIWNTWEGRHHNFLNIKVCFLKKHSEMLYKLLLISHPDTFSNDSELNICRLLPALCGETQIKAKSDSTASLLTLKAHDFSYIVHT